MYSDKSLKGKLILTVWQHWLIFNNFFEMLYLIISMSLVYWNSVTHYIGDVYLRKYMLNNSMKSCLILLQYGNN